MVRKKIRLHFSTKTAAPVLISLEPVIIYFWQIINYKFRLGNSKF